MELPVQPGDLVGGKYVIEALLGAGGMGAVFLANHEQLRRHVAIKFLLSEAMSNPDAFARFEREAHAAAALQSDNVTRVIDMGALPGGAPYIVMEYLEGEDLAARLMVEGRLPIEQAVAYVIEACDALSEAHALGIVHRDLKPANLFLARRPNGSVRVKVLDFGISKMSASGNAKGMSLTGTGAVMGSPLYMSPEQLKGSGKVDERSDIWSLGVVLYEFLAGQPPYMGDAFPEQCALILTAAVPPLRAKRPDVSPRLEAVVMRCLAKEASARFSHVGELTAALLAAVPNANLGASGRLAVSQAPSTVPDARGAGGTLALSRTPRPSPQREGSVTAVPVSHTGVPQEMSRRAMGIIVALAACALGAAAVIFAMRPSSDHGAPPPIQAVQTSPVAAPGPAIPTPPSEPSTATPPPPDTAAPAAPPATAASPSQPTAPSSPGARPRSHASPPAPATPPPSPVAPPAAAPAAPAPGAKDCSTPYYFDAQGNKVFKPDCLK
jgi:serine/threonine-protein kinase